MRPTDRSGTFNSTSGGVPGEIPERAGAVLEAVGDATMVVTVDVTDEAVGGLAAAEAVGATDSAGVANVRKRQQATKPRMILRDDMAEEKTKGMRGRGERESV